MSENKKRDRDLAKFLIGKFLNSNLSHTEEFSWITAHANAIIRYMCDIIDINYSQTGQEICDKSNQQIAKFSRTSERSVKNFIPYFIKYGFLIVLSNEIGKISTYGIGPLLKTITLNTQATIAQVYPQENDDLGNHCLGTQATIAYLPRQPLPTSNSSCKNYCNKEQLLPVDNFTNEEQNIPCDLEMNEENERLAKERGVVSIIDVHQKFIKFFLEKGGIKKTITGWHEAERNWILKERQTNKPKNETKCTVPEANPENKRQTNDEWKKTKGTYQSRHREELLRKTNLRHKLH